MTIARGFKAVLTSGLLYASTAEGHCLISNIDTRLRSFCVTEVLLGNLVTLRDVTLLDTILKREGYARGLGFPGAVPTHSFAPFAVPVVDYNTNINGGNPDRSLRIGNLDFEGDPNLVRTKGLVAGAAVGGNGRSIVGAGRYIDYSVGASLVGSTQHDQIILRTYANACSKNHISNLWYVDACAATNRTKREIQTDRSSSVSLSAVKLIDADDAYHQASVGVRRYFDKDYEQNQLVASVETIRIGSIYTNLSITLGESIENTLAIRQSISATVGTAVMQKPLRATFNYGYSDGGKLLGVDRSDVSQSFNITYAAHPHFSISLGYRNTNSSIDYFDEYEPNIGVQFNTTFF